MSVDQTPEPSAEERSGGAASDGTTAGRKANADEAQMLRPPVPVAKRLNRNALTVAAALAGVTVLTVIVVTNPSRTGTGPSTQATGGNSDRAPAIPAHPAFLDQPPRLPVQRSTSDSSRGEVASSVSLAVSSAAPGLQQHGASATQLPTRSIATPAGPTVGRSAAAGFGGGLVAQPSGTDAVEQSAYGMYGSDGLGTVSPSRPAGPADVRGQAYQAALTSSVFAGGGEAAREPAGGNSNGGGYLAGPSNDPALFNRSLELAAVMRGAPAGLAAANGAAPAGVPVSVSTSTAAHLDSTGSPFTIWAGTLIPGLMVTGVNSDLPGEVVGQTSRDVYDSRTQQILLLPKGARLIGAYDNRLVSTGRLVVAWTRIILPDGRSMTLPRLPSTDEHGQAGLHDQVDSHYGKLYGTALLTSALTAGIQLSQPQQAGLYAAPSPGQVAAGSLGQNVGNVSLESARRGLDVPPTLIIRPGQPFNVFLGGDVVFDSPYVPTTFAAAP